jgi:hypothetical protein
MLSAASPARAGPSSSKGPAAPRPPARPRARSAARSLTAVARHSTAGDALLPRPAVAAARQGSAGARRSTTGVGERSPANARRAISVSVLPRPARPAPSRRPRRTLALGRGWAATARIPSSPNRTATACAPPPAARSVPAALAARTLCPCDPISEICPDGPCATDADYVAQGLGYTHCVPCSGCTNGGRDCVTACTPCPTGERLCGEICCPNDRDCCRGVCCSLDEQCRRSGANRQCMTQ